LVIKNDLKGKKLKVKNKAGMAIGLDIITIISIILFYFCVISI